jgi:hypothetical protein
MPSRRFKIDRKLRQEVKRLPCAVCGSRHRVDPAHIATFGSRGFDRVWSMIPLCRAHHNEQHTIGWKRFTDRYPRVMALLKMLGWELLEVNGFYKLFNQKEIDDGGGN